MSQHDITVQGGTSVRLPTAGKYCDRDILIHASAGGVDLPTLTNEGTASDLMRGKQLISGSGSVVSGSFTLDTELSEQDSLIERLRTALQGKMAGGGGDPTLPAGYVRTGYIQFNDKQIVDTGIICNQNTKIKFAFTREITTAHYIFGVASSDNTAAVTAYIGGNWRFGNKAQSKSPATNKDMIYGGVMSSSEITITSSQTAISGVNDFETIGTLLLGACRNSNGSIPSPTFVGKIFFFSIWQGDVEVLHLSPVVSTDGVYRFYDEVSQSFFDSITDTPLEGGNL